MSKINYDVNHIFFPFSLARQHFGAISKEAKWGNRIVHLIVGILELIFPINYIVAIFDRKIGRARQLLETEQLLKEALLKVPQSYSFPKNEEPLDLTGWVTPTTSGGEEKPVVIGIDLGTTNSCVAFMDGHTIKVIPDETGARTTPSIISYKDKDPVVGTEAKRLAAKYPESTLYSTKRFIGRKYKEIESEIKGVPYKVIENANGDPVFEVNGKLITPEEAGAQILIKMRQIAERHLGKKVTKAVVTVPAYFNDRQRQATRDAGRLAGLDVIRIISEPTAAALAYGVDKKKGEQKIAVYDLGGGTFDISILHIDQGVFEVRSTNGDTHLGGDDFDSAIAAWMVDQFKKEHGIDLSRDKVAMERLRSAAVKAKMVLTTKQTAKIDLSSLVTLPTGSKNLTLELSRAKLEEICRSLIQRTVEPCRNAMNDANVKQQNINEVVLVGGMTRMPGVQNMVREIFGRNPNKSVNPDEAVAIGAAIQGGIIEGDIDNVLLLDVAPLTLGVQTEGGIMTPLINRNTTIPTTKKMIFSTAKDNQAGVDIVVLQGERKMSADNKEIGRFSLVGIPPALRGVPQIEVSFCIDSNGVLEVSAVDKLTGKEQKVVIKAKSGLTKEFIQSKIQEAQLNEAKDKARLESIETRKIASEFVRASEVLLSETKKIKIPFLPSKWGISSELSNVQLGVDALKKALEGDDTVLIKTRTTELEKSLQLVRKKAEESQNLTPSNAMS